MKRSIYLNLIIIISLASGCAGLEKMGVYKPKVRTPERETQFVKVGRIVDAQRLAKGGKILILPFKAGPDVESTEELDKISFRIIKGASEVLNGSSNFEVLVNDNADEADMVIKGYVTSMGNQSSKLKKVILMGGKPKLSVQGRLIDRETSKTIAVYADGREIQHADQDLNQLGILLGKDIGEFILNGM